MKIPDSFYSVQFSKATMFGYKTEDVDLFVETAFRFLDELQSENTKLTEALEQREQELQRYRNDEETLRSALVGSQKLAKEHVENAQKQAEEILRAAEEKADKTISAIIMKKQELEYSYQEESKAIAEFKNSVFGLYVKHIEIMQRIPEKAKAFATENLDEAVKSIRDDIVLDNYQETEFISSEDEELEVDE